MKQQPEVPHWALEMSWNKAVFNEDRVAAPEDDSTPIFADSNHFFGRPELQPGLNKHRRSMQISFMRVCAVDPYTPPFFYTVQLRIKNHVEDYFDFSGFKRGRV